MELATFIPTVERAADMLLPGGAIESQERLCALLVRADMVIREVWRELDALDHKTYQRLAAARVPAKLQAGAVHHVIGEELERTAHWVRCRVEHYTDKHVVLHETWLPGALKAMQGWARFETALESLIMPATPPEALRCMDLTPKVHGSAYRTHTVKQPDFHGHSFGDAIDQAKTALDRILGRCTGEVVADIRAYAWPLLWLRYADQRDVVLFVDPKGGIHAFTGDESHGRA
jgi:hypothetical protein